MAILSNAKSPWISINDALISDFFDVFLPVGDSSPLSQVSENPTDVPQAAIDESLQKALSQGLPQSPETTLKIGETLCHQGTCYLSFFRVDFPM